MNFAAGFASGWISCLGFLAAIGFVLVYICVTGRFPSLRWRGHDGPPDE